MQKKQWQILKAIDRYAFYQGCKEAKLKKKEKEKMQNDTNVVQTY